MLDKIKKELYFFRMQLLMLKGLYEGKITNFDDDFYEKMSQTYFGGIPVSIHIKYLKPTTPPGRCYDRSLYMFLCFENALLVRGDVKDLELRFGKEDAGHGWIEINNYVYDPSYLLRFDKDLYYKIFLPENITKCSKEEYCSDIHSKAFYDDITKTTIEDMQPGGRKRVENFSQILIIKAIANLSNNQEFIVELNKYLSLIQYDEIEMYNELKEKIKSLI